MSKFKIGDRVRSHAPSSIYTITRDGWEGTVVRLDSNNHIRVSGSPERGPNEWIVDEQYFDLIEEYTIDYIKDRNNKVAVFLDSKEQYDALAKAGCRMSQWYGQHYYSPSDGTYWSGMRKGELKYSSQWRPILKEIEYSQIKFENMTQKLVGYKLVRAIPGDNRKVGDVVNSDGPTSYYDVLKDYWEPVYKNVEEEIEIGGYKAEFYTNEVKFGCQSFNRSQVDAFKRFVENGGYIEIDGYKISYDLLGKILKRIK